MESLNLSQLTSKLLDLPPDSVIDLYISNNYCNFAKYHYICTSVDALSILTIFTGDYSFQFKILQNETFY